MVHTNNRNDSIRRPQQSHPSLSTAATAN
jgi:hypothetical protein